MKKIVGKVFYIFFGLAIHCEWYVLLALICSWMIKERMSDGKISRPSSTAKNDRITILALTPDRFRGDLDVLAKTENFRVLQIVPAWQVRLVYYFLRCRLERSIYARRPSEDPLFKRKDKFCNFLRKFLPILYGKVGIDCVISPHIEYAEDMDWGEISQEIGVPYIVFHRESLLPTPGSKNAVISRMKKISSFKGSRIVVHSELTRQFYLDIGYVEPDKITTLGCLRMDNLIKNIHKKESVQNQRKKVVVIPFYLTQFRDDSLYHYFKEVYLTFIQFANKYSEIDVVIKPKNKKEYKNLYEMLDRIIEGTEIVFEKISNLYIRSDLDVQELLLEADVVCGLRSTALLEAAITENPVIVPYFKVLQDPKYNDYIPFKDSYHLFDLAESVGELKSLILYRLENPKIEEKIMEGRKALFEKYVSSMKGDATEKYVALIKSVVAEELKRAR